MIDTHTHLYLPEFDEDGGGVSAVQRALANGVHHLIFPNVDHTTVEPMEALAAQFPGQISVAMGFHPTEVNDHSNAALESVLERFNRPDHGYVAVGEIGIDLYWDATFRNKQMQVFDRQVAFAQQLNLPIIIHCREGLAETLEVLSGHRGVPAVFHSFGGTIADVETIRRLGDYYFGINGIVTFKNSKLRDVLPAIGLDRILLETDSPYLAPVPKRGRRNESAYLPYTCAHIAQGLGRTATEVADATTANAATLFRLSLA